MCAAQRILQCPAEGCALSLRLLLGLAISLRLNAIKAKTSSGPWLAKIGPVAIPINQLITG